jgi:SM-20-related protein
MIDKILQDLESEGISCVPYLVDSKTLDSVHHFFELKKAEFTPAKVGLKDNKQRVESIRGDFSYWLDPLTPPRELVPLFKLLDNLRQRVNAQFYLGLQDYECHLAYYPEGTFYRKHLDRFEKDSSRKLTFIFYLNNTWSPEFGGELVVYNKDGSIKSSYLPLPGTFICFLSDEFPHEVRSATHERRSFTGWMHTKRIY